MTKAIALIALTLALEGALVLTLAVPAAPARPAPAGGVAASCAAAPGRRC